MKKIGDLVKELLASEGMGGLNDLSRIKDRWSEIVGERMAGASRPFKLEKGRLYIGVASHSWAQELHYRVGEIKECVAEDPGIDIREVVIRKINLR